MRLLGLGDNVMDAYLFRDELYPGGNAANVAVLSKRAGAQESGYLGILALDAAGQHFAKTLQEEGIDTTKLRKAEGITACNYIHLDENGDRIFSGNNGQETVQNQFQLMLTKADRQYASTFDVIHTSIHSKIDEALPWLSQKSWISMDYSSDGFTHINIEKLAPYLHFAFLSSGGKEAEAMREIMEFAADCGIPEVICTLGIRGSCGISNGKYWQTPAYPDENALDALGAGDAFIASFLVEYTDNGGDACKASDAAAHFAASNCDHHGAFGHPLKIEDSGLCLD